MPERDDEEGQPDAGFEDDFNVPDLATMEAVLEARRQLHVARDRQERVGNGALALIRYALIAIEDIVQRAGYEEG